MYIMRRAEDVRIWPRKVNNCYFSKIFLHYPCGFMATCTWIHGRVLVGTRPSTRGYMAKCTWIYGLVLTETRPHACEIHGHLHSGVNYIAVF